MVLESELAGMFLKYFKEREFSDKEVYTSPKDSTYLELGDFAFKFKVDKANNLELLIYPPEGGETIIGKHLSRCIEKPASDIEISEKRRQSINKYWKFLKDNKSYRRGDSYIFEATFASNNKRMAFYSLLNCIVRPLLSFPREE